MIANATLVIPHDTADDAGHVDDPDLDPTLLEDLPRDRLDGALAELDEAAGQAPFPKRRRLAAADEQHLALVQDDGAHADSRVVRILAAHTGPLSQSSVAYFSRTRRSTRATSSALSPSGRRVILCSASNAPASASATSSNFGR